MPKAFRFTLVLIVLIAVYFGWVYYDRWSTRQALLQNLEEKNNTRNRPLSKVYGDGSLKIMNFYTTAPTIRPGETAQLCYGVASAEAVRIEPPVEDVWPAISRCVEVSPKTDTTYKLIAEDEDGNTATAETNIRVIRE